MKTFIEKIKNIMSKLAETNYDIFDGDVDDAVETIEKALFSFPNYANIVIREQIMVPMWRIRLEADDFRERVQDIDRQRHNYHEAAIASVNILNRICGLIGVDYFADIDTNDRYAVADMVGDFVIELYRAGTDRHGMDGATYKVQKEYDQKVASDLVRNLAEKGED